jgi:hypothetical protein
MKKLGVLIAILLLLSKSFYGQVVATGAVSCIQNAEAAGNALAGCDANCAEITNYTWFAPEITCPDGAQVTGNWGDGNHYPMQASILVPSGCVVDVVAEYGGPNNLGSCSDSRMDADDVLGINPGFNSPGTTTSGDESGVGCIGVCSGGAAGVSGGTTLHGGSTNLAGTVGAPGCYVSGGSGNSDVICTATGITNTSITVWGMANRADEILTYTVTQTSGAGTCATLGIVVLPVEIIGLAAYGSNNNITIAWATATETNNNYFMIQYSLDGINFINYKEVKGAGNSNSRKNYSCNFNLDIGDYTPYFRLKQVDYNGNFKYSSIVALGNSLGYPKTISPVNVYYNTDNSAIISKFKLDAPSQINFSLYDLTGQEVYTSTNQFAEGDNQFSIPVPDVSGIYILVYQNGSSAPVHKKVMVTK